MLDNKGFDLWAKTFDQTVEETDDEKSYPFAGYKEIINEIYKRILNSKAHRVLDLGFGFRVIIVIEANSYVNIRSSRLLPKFKTQKINSWCAA